MNSLNEEFAEDSALISHILATFNNATHYSNIFVDYFYVFKIYYLTGYYFCLFLQTYNTV